jgi:hypothetical protein
MHSIEDTTSLGIHRYPSAALYEVMRSNLLTLDLDTRNGRAAYCGGWGHPEENVTANPFTKSKGGFRYLPGMTTLTVVVRVSDSISGGTWASGDSLRIYLNDALVQTTALPGNGDQTITHTLGSYALNSAVEVQLQIYSASRPSDDTQWGLYEIIDAYVSPVTLSDTWPGVPTFTTVYDAAKLTQLANAVDWLTRLVGRRTDPLFQAIVRASGPYGPSGEEAQGQSNVRWYGSMVTTTTAPILKVTGNVLVQAPATEEVRLLVNGSVVATYNVPLDYGQHTWTLSYTMPQSAGTRVYVEVWYRRLSVGPIVNKSEQTNRWSLIRVWSEGLANSHAAITIPAMTARTDGSWATWKAALNACATTAGTIYSRITAAANNSLWLRQYLYRGSYAYGGYGSKNEPSFEWIYIPNCPARIGNGVLVRGVGNTVDFGAQGFDESESAKNGIGAYKLVATYSETATGQANETALVYFDALKNLPPGANYNVRGASWPARYAGEIWRVGNDV